MMLSNARTKGSRFVMASRYATSCLKETGWSVSGHTRRTEH